MARNPKQDANLEKGKATRFNSETAARAGKKGSIASAAARRARRDMRQMLEDIMTKANDDPKMAEKLIEDGFQGDDNIHAAAILASLIKKAQKGDLQAQKMIWEYMFGKQDQNVNVNMSESKVTFYLPEKEPEDE